jgi:hypothetical protein
MEVIREAHEFKRLMDERRHACQYHFSALEPLAIPLGIPQRTNTGAGHILDVAHIHNDFVPAAMLRSLERACQLRRLDAIHPTSDGNQFQIIDFFRCDFHVSSSLPINLWLHF